MHGDIFFVHPSVYLSIHSSIHLFCFHPATVHPLVRPSVLPSSSHRSIHLFSLHPATRPAIIHPSVLPSSSPFFQPPIPPSSIHTRPSVPMSIHPLLLMCQCIFVRPGICIATCPRSMSSIRLQSGPRQQHSIKTHKLHHNQYS